MRNPFRDIRGIFKEGNFFGRKAYLDDICYGLTNDAFASFNIYGSTSIGKTWLLKQVEIDVKLRSSGKELKHLYFDVAGRNSEDVLHEVCTNLLAELDTEDDAPPRKLNVKPGVKESVEDALQNLIAHLNKRENKNRLYVICLDHADSGLKGLPLSIQYQLRALAILQPLIIITRQPLSNIIDSGSPLSNLLTDIEIGLFEEAEAMNFIQVVSGSGKAESKQEEDDSPSCFNTTECKFLLESAGRHPFLLTLVCESYYADRRSDSRLEGLLNDPKVQERLFAQWGNRPPVLDMHRALWESLNKKEQSVLHRIARSNEPLKSEASKLDLTNVAWSTLDALKQKSLIESDVVTGQIQGVFSILFCLYVLQQEDTEENGQTEKSMSTTVRDIDISLSERDRRLLKYFQQHVDQVCTYKELKEYLGVEQGTSFSNNDEEHRGLEAAIYRIRTALQKAYARKDKFFYSIRNVGYVFKSEPSLKTTFK